MKAVSVYLQPIVKMYTTKRLNQLSQTMVGDKVGFLAEKEPYKEFACTCPLAAPVSPCQPFWCWHTTPFASSSGVACVCVSFHVHMRPWLTLVLCLLLWCVRFTQPRTLATRASSSRQSPRSAQTAAAVSLPRKRTPRKSTMIV